MLLLSGCGYLSGTEDILVAPHINERQAEVHAALGATLNLSDIQYKYPQQGDYRSPFILYDLDADGRQEAIVFYAFRDDPAYIRAKILREGEGGWYSAYDITGGGDQVKFIQFALLRGEGGDSMLVGWQDARRSTTLSVYSLVDGALNEEFSRTYTDYLVVSARTSSRKDILIVSQDDSGFYQASLLGLGIGGHLQELSAFSLAQEATHVLQLMQGRLWDNTTGIYVDLLLDGTTTATEIIRVAGGALEPVAAQIGGEDFSNTFREDDSALCVDLEGDGVVEVPVLFPLSGQEDESPELPALSLTQFMHIDGNGFKPVYSAVVNDEYGYLLYFPERWVDTVTVRRLVENGEWQFYGLDPESGEPATELLRIRVYSVRDYQDKFIGSYELLAENGLLRYYAYIPAMADEPLAVTADEVEKMFLLL